MPAPPARSSASYTTENIVAADVSPTEDFEAFRPLLFGVAYRMLGSASDAEDAVQETWLRWHGATGIEAPQAWLIRVVTNICLDQLRSARVRREEYVGPWLPEPVLTGESVDDPLAAVQRRELLSLGALRVLERLSPRERAALVLHEGLGLSHAEVATALGATEAASRQLLARARRRLPADLRAPGGRRADPTEHRRLTEAMGPHSTAGTSHRCSHCCTRTSSSSATAGGRFGRRCVRSRAPARYCDSWPVCVNARAPGWRCPPSK